MQVYNVGYIGETNRKTSEKAFEAIQVWDEAWSLG